MAVDFGEDDFSINSDFKAGCENEGVQRTIMLLVLHINIL